MEHSGDKLNGARGDEKYNDAHANVHILIGLGVAIMVPLLYALVTLLGMQHKRVYPILRVKERDGRVSLVEESGGVCNELRCCGSGRHV